MFVRKWDLDKRSEISASVLVKFRNVELGGLRRLREK